MFALEIGQSIFRKIQSLLGLLSAVAITGAIALAGFRPAVAAAAACESLADLALPDTTITLAESIPAGTFTPPDSPSINNLPAFCRVVGVIRPTSDSNIVFEVWMPSDGWNRKFQGVGNGGFAGVISYAAMGTALKLGYATASTDTGHVGTPEGSGIALPPPIPEGAPLNGLVDASWAPGHPERVIDFGYRGLHEMTVKAKEVTRAFYGDRPTLSYFTGCSGGGRQGIMEAQRYPDDYNGIVAGDPTISFTRLLAGGRLWEVLATLGDPTLASYIPASKVTLLANAVVEACDALDGVLDGILADPRRCQFDPSMLQCPDGDAPTCLTAPQVVAVQKIWVGVRNSAGEQIYPRYLPGGEIGSVGWVLHITGTAPYTGVQFLYAENFFKHMVFEDLSWDFRNFNYDTDVSISDQKLVVDQTLASVVNGTNPNLEAFKRRGGKLIHYHGWSDPGVSPLGSVEYYESVVAAMRRAHHGHHQHDDDEGFEATQEFYRLFMVPGMEHCSGGPGTDHFDALTALERWVEHGIEPNRILASHLNPDGSVAFTRPLCPYPQEAVYRGHGSIDDARNFRCLVRERDHQDHGDEDDR